MEENQVMIDLPYDYLGVSGWKLISTWNPKQPDFLWLFQLDDSKPLLGKWLFHQTSI